jgi:hypothetical protein
MSSNAHAGSLIASRFQVAVLSIACGPIFDTFTRGRRELKLIACLAFGAPGEKRLRS